MSYYYRSNLAVELEDSPGSVTKKKTKRTVRIKPSIPTKEKLMYLFFITLVVIGVGMVGVRYSQISQYNYEIQRLKKEIRINKEKNTSLQLQIEQLSNRDRIIMEAERMGMVYNPEAAHLVGQSKEAAKKDGKGSKAASQKKQP
ncbi:MULTISPECIES: cell division protein FtsL [Bacillati]|jgi:cell division protein FtsL|uniref:Cell division protein FtsL n=1 Tax=Brevibacillus borstelensis AK1 TaxID=1300222 RepID=M8E5D9_9BACL|nr:MULTISPECIES: cell division protein FtsL [Terrabacteria group]EMT54501.1 cell division protein FtsL [Brevibacillus borstelensis AK1]KKX54394.1 cell division protein FtsL [Brevibacillus borstelensis cifa_chp40]MBE5395900.1 cell division protein FtsL [Brevibacillus borstelensis]MCC0563280.1 cell division protein FtsL [Brevibacillus borstelensis]MCM3471247.1 cell division protein FtsL [Brevibacillus borstelensis]